MRNVVSQNLSKLACDPRKLQKLCDWIDQNIHESIGWTQLTQQSGMGHLELQREFSMHLQTSPMQWIRSRRRELEQTTMAQQFLMQKQLPEKLMHKTN
jgi:AraC-like DNA-binding protein